MSSRRNWERAFRAQAAVDLAAAELLHTHAGPASVRAQLLQGVYEKFEKARRFR
jgi:hypothetical protein